MALPLSLANAAGIQRLTVDSPTDGIPALEGAVWYPCAEQLGSVEFRNVEMAGSLDCPVAGSSLPLVVISHGARGWFGGHHDTAAALADAGYVVAAVSHPDIGRSWQTNRPAAVKWLVDYMVKTWPEHDQLDLDRSGSFDMQR